MKTERTTGEKVVKFVSYFVLTVLTLIVLIPILYVFRLTFSMSANAGFRAFLKGSTLQCYQYVFESGTIQKPFLNPLTMAACSLVVSVVLTVGIIYPLPRKRLAGREVFNFIVILPMLLSLGFPPRYLLTKDLDLMDSLLSLIFPTAMNTFNTTIMRNFLETIPDSLIGSARIDGCSEMKILLKIVLPLPMAALATAVLLHMVASWNSYLGVILYIGDPQKYTLQVALGTLAMKNSVGSSSADLVLLRNVQYTTIIVALLPVIIVYPSLQKYSVEGIMIGSVKG